MSGHPSLSVPPEGEFFRSRWVEAPEGISFNPDGTLPEGFRAGGVHCGLKGGGATDLGAVICESEEVASAILLTANAAAAAPIRVCRENLWQGEIRSVIVNSGNANAATGEQGITDALSMRNSLATELGLAPQTVAVAETGVIGVPMDMDAVLSGISGLASSLTTDGAVAFSEAIMTTDKWPKRVSLTVDGITLSAQAKGAGMIEPGFATMLCFVQTDAVVPDPEGALRQAVGGSFERITVDGQMSTNDTVLLQASGISGRELPEGLLDSVLLQLALEIVSDGEGASRVGRVEVTGAADSAEAEMVARKIANSPLVKTALLGRDPNWGRIAQAAGQALAGQDIGELGPEVIEAGDIAAGGREPELALRLDRGNASAHVFTSDLTHEYIVINAEYTT
ncbi:MAG: bifunctional glutamate N-acetyltransferase/amino-acid acetyltransferase ArgJ [Solirubrobacterales bacterium]|nr:bifunctional glutamate N-acetyltransferase/amino-acid acetyltransferase ArgJ [Solirubrobacterales bacterium]MCB0859917.1 bifunctional glutamate N-acetyltransferase/amino-acid acetyltransferase ArgJ [Solirubrobacterales bacterium]